MSEIPTKPLSFHPLAVKYNPLCCYGGLSWQAAACNWINSNNASSSRFSAARRHGRSGRARSKP
jgi:hypothetical protein